MQVLRILLPVLWAVVSTVIGWRLHKWSTSRIELKWAAFTGAAVIAAAAFFAMYRATAALQVDPRLGSASRAAAELETAAAQADKDCITPSDTPRDKQRCADSIHDLKVRSAQVHELLVRLSGD